MPVVSQEPASRAARKANLIYVDPNEPGIRRVRAGKGCRYVNSRQRPVRSAATLERIRRLAIPPAWNSVWICPSPRGHIQAVGMDARGRKQYLYHAAWRLLRDEVKFDNLVDFARQLPKIRQTVTRHLRDPGLKREKVLAAVVRLLETTLIRIGNPEYARQNGSFGLTTMRDRHVRRSGCGVVFDFRGKSRIHHKIDLEDSRLARVVLKCQQLPGQQLFQYRDEAGKLRRVSSADVNDYLRSISGSDFTAKEFRTWAGTVLAARFLAQSRVSTKTKRPQQVVEELRRVAHRLGNTLAVCRKSYVHPAVVDCFLEGTLADELSAAKRVESAVIRLIVRRSRRNAKGTGRRGMTVGAIKK
jgi:DNA topoisomerase-1